MTDKFRRVTCSENDKTVFFPNKVFGKIYIYNVFFLGEINNYIVSSEKKSGLDDRIDQIKN